MDVYLSEKEQIQKIKDWFKQYGITIVVCLVVFFGASFGWRYWQSYKAQRAEKASVLYEQMLTASFSHSNVNAKLFANKLMHNYSSTPYAGLAALMSARTAIAAGDITAAQQSLQWAVHNADNKSFKQIARVRLARVYIAMKKPQQALEVLDKVDDSAYQSLINEVKGDALLALGQKSEALLAYKSALSSKNNMGVNSAILAMKVNLLLH